MNGDHRIRLEVSGPAACFTRPEYKVERVSYECLTPSAAVGILKAIYWHPGMDWEIERIHVCKPVRFATLMRNEVSAKGSGTEMAECFRKHTLPAGISVTKIRAQRSTMYLKDVRYVIEAHPIALPDMAPGDTLTKFHQIFIRRAKKGQCFHQPCLGCREFPVRSFRLLDLDELVKRDEGVKDQVLGLMLYGMDYTDLRHIRPMFFPAEIKNGVLQVEGKEVSKCS